MLTSTLWLQIIGAKTRLLVKSDGSGTIFYVCTACSGHGSYVKVLMPISMLSDSAMDVAALWAKVLELRQSHAYVVYISHTQFMSYSFVGINVSTLSLSLSLNSECNYIQKIKVHSIQGFERSCSRTEIRSLIQAFVSTSNEESAFLFYGCRDHYLPVYRRGWLL